MNQIAHCDMATRASCELSCLLGTTRCISEKTFPESHIINALLTKLGRSRWLDIRLVLFCEFIDLNFVSALKHAKNNLTSHLVNNPYIYFFRAFLLNFRWRQIRTKQEEDKHHLPLFKIDDFIAIQNLL